MAASEGRHRILETLVYIGLRMLCININSKAGGGYSPDNFQHLGGFTVKQILQ